VLFSALDSPDVFTSLAAADALLRHLELVNKSRRHQLGDLLARESAPSAGDRFRAVSMLVRLVVLARADELFFFEAAAAAQRYLGKQLDATGAERVTAAVGLLDAGHPDDQLVRLVESYLGHEDLEVQAEASFQLARCEVRRSIGESDEEKRRARLEAAEQYFAAAATVERRTDAQLWLELLAILRRFAETSEVEGEGLARVRELARLRIEASPPLAYTWRTSEDWFLLRAANQLAAQAGAIEGAELKASLVGPLLHAAAAATDSAALLGHVGLSENSLPYLVARTAIEGLTVSLDVKVQYAIERVSDAINTETDSKTIAFLNELREGLRRRRSRPKGEGGAPEGEAPEAKALAFADKQISRLAMRTGSLVGDAILDRIQQQLFQLALLEASDERELATAVLECVIGFVCDRTIDPTLLGMERQDYLYSEKRGGKGTTALEEDLRSDFLRFVINNRDYRELVAKEQKVGDGRTDVRFLFNRFASVVETKRELQDASIDALTRNYLPQAQTYAAVGPRLGFLLVLDITEKRGAPERGIRSRFELRHLEPRSGPDDWPDYVLVAVVDGNRVPPSDR